MLVASLDIIDLRGRLYQVLSSTSINGSLSFNELLVPKASRMFNARFAGDPTLGHL